MFRPGLPPDTHAVLMLYAVAARVVCERPADLGTVSKRLSAIEARLVPPEAVAAHECARLWRMFARAASASREDQRMRAGKALCRELEALGQRFDLPPMVDFADLPAFLNQPDAADLEAEESAVSAGPTLEQAREQARAACSELAPKAAFPVQTIASLLSRMSAEQQQRLFKTSVGEGLLGRSDINLLVRWLAKGASVGPQDAVLIEVLERVGRWLGRDQ